MESIKSTWLICPTPSFNTITQWSWCEGSSKRNMYIYLMRMFDSVQQSPTAVWSTLTIKVLNSERRVVLTSRGRYVCFCSWPTCRQGKWGYLSCRLYFSRKYCATVLSTVCPFSSCSGNLTEKKYLRHYKGNNLELVRTYFGALFDLKLFWFLTCWKKLQINKQNKKRCKMANRSWAHLKLPLLRAPFTHVWWLAGRRVTLHTLYFRLMVPQCVTSTFRPEQKEYRFKLRSDILHNPKLQHLQSFRFDMLFWVVDGTACTQGNTNWKMSSCWINLGSHRGSHIDFLFSYLNYRSL